MTDEPSSKRARTTWMTQHSKMWDDLGDRVGEKFAEAHPVVGMSERAADCVSLAVAHNPDVKFIDVSQAAARKAWSTGVRALVTGSSIFCVPLQRLLSPSEHLELLGWYGPDVSTDAFGPCVLKNLAGEGMSVPSVTLVTICGLLALEDIWV